MVKERKAQFGVTNLSARTGGDVSAITTTGPNDLSSTPTKASKFSRNFTHLTELSVETKASTKSSSESTRLTATWKPVPVAKTDFNTTYTDSFQFHTKQLEHAVHHAAHSYHNKSITNSKEEDEAINKLCDVIQNNFGTAELMMKTVSH